MTESSHLVLSNSKHSEGDILPGVAVLSVEDAGISLVAFVVLNRYNGIRQPPCGQRVMSENTQTRSCGFLYIVESVAL